MKTRGAEWVKLDGQDTILNSVRAALTTGKSQCTMAESLQLLVVDNFRLVRGIGVVVKLVRITEKVA